jgi:solute carrier family 25 oxoglutarate transporter 11
VLLDAVGGPSVPFTSKLAVGVAAGSFGGLVGNPAEVVLVRMAAGGRGYRHVGDALSRIVKEEGAGALLTGLAPTVVRAAVITSSQLATFTEAKERLKPILDMQEGVPLHFCAAMVSGAVTVAVSMPFDVVKTAMQNQKAGAEASHSSSIGCAVQLWRRGPSALWNGALPFWLKVGPHTVISLVMVEQLRAFTKVSN